MLGGNPARWLLAAALLGVAIDGSASAQPRVIAYGDSYVQPAPSGLRSGQAPWLALLHEPLANHGHPGDGAAKTLAIVRRTAGQVHGGVVVVEVGINDVRRNGTDLRRLAAFRLQYESLLGLLSPARLVVVVPPLPVLRYVGHAPNDHGSVAALALYRQAVLDLASRHANVRVADPARWWRPEAMLLPDGLHPDALGRAVIADVVQAARGARARPATLR